MNFFLVFPFFLVTIDYPVHDESQQQQQQQQHQTENVGDKETQSKILLSI